MKTKNLFKAYEEAIKQTYSFELARHGLKGAVQIAKTAYKESAFDVNSYPLATKKATPANDFFDTKVFSAYKLLKTDMHKMKGTNTTIDTMDTKYEWFSKKINEFDTKIEAYFGGLELNNENYFSFINKVCKETDAVKKQAFQDYCAQHDVAMPVTDINLYGSDKYSVMCTQSFIDTACGWYDAFAHVA